MQGAAFGDLAGDNEQLFRHLDHAWKGFDPAAPIYMTKAQEREMESRRDTTALRQRISVLAKAKASSTEIASLSNRLTFHRKRLEELAIMARRENYFKNKARSRQLGLQDSRPASGERGPEELQDDQEEEHYTGTFSHTELDIDALI